MIGKKPILNKLPMQLGDVQITYADISHAREVLGYNPHTKLEDGPKVFWDWYQKAMIQDSKEIYQTNDLCMKEVMTI